jgi:hypothetical protein
MVIVLSLPMTTCCKKSNGLAKAITPMSGKTPIARYIQFSKECQQKTSPLNKQENNMNWQIVLAR